MSFRTSNKILLQKRSKDKSPVDELPTIDDTDPGNGGSTTKKTENGIVIPGLNIMSSNGKRKRTDGSTNNDHADKSPVCCLQIGSHFTFFKQEDLEESYTLKLLVNSDDELEAGDGDVCRIHGATLPTASLNPQRFSQATLHTAWLLLRTAREPNISTYSVDQELHVGEEFPKLSGLFPDGGQLSAAATLFDLGLALRCPRLQKAAFEWYQRIRSITWSGWFAQPSNWQWVAEKMPEGRYWIEEYAAWLRILKTHDPEMSRLRKGMMEATGAVDLGLATDLSELETLEPRRLYEYHMGEGVPSEVAEEVSTS